MSLWWACLRVVPSSMPGRVLPARVLCALLLAYAAALSAGPPASAAPRPITAAFYYAWYPETWKPTPHATPSLGHYQSMSTRIVRTHLRELRRAHVQAAIVSWWGIGDRSDGRFRRPPRRPRPPGAAADGRPALAGADGRLLRAGGRRRSVRRATRRRHHPHP